MANNSTPMSESEQELERELAEARRERDDKDKQLASCYDKLCKAESRLRDSCLESRGDQEFPPCARAIEAESRAAAAYDLLRECVIKLQNPIERPDFSRNLIKRIEKAMGERNA
jgi:hypothetical protein